MEISQETRLKFHIYRFIEKQICGKTSEEEKGKILENIENIIQYLKFKALK